eukprot:PhF_6_TR23892/c0_g1_i1/m.33464
MTYQAKRSGGKDMKEVAPAAHPDAGKGELGHFLAALYAADKGASDQTLQKAQQYWNNITTNLITKLPPPPQNAPYTTTSIKVKLLVAEDVDDTELQRVVSEEDEAKWKRKAEERRLQFKKTGVMYNKSILPQMLSKGPSGPGFAAGRGKPTK